MTENVNHLMYTLTYQMVKSENYELLHINDQIKEVWLHRKENKISKVVRITSQGFDWKNHLKKDIAQVFQKTKALKKYLPKKKVEIDNIYLTKHVPVDDWEVLKKPMMLNEKNPIRMNVYYLAEENFGEEKKRLEDNLNFSLPVQTNGKTEDEIEQETHNYKNELVKLITRRQKSDREIFSFGKPRLVYLLLIINLLMYFILEINGGSESIETLIKYGAKYNPAILIDGEWWRIISSMFLHIGFIHLLMNMLAVYYLGTLIERIYGSWRFAIIYFLAGIGGGLASFAFTNNVSAGASGALFGLFGALLFFGLVYKRLFFQTIGMNVLILIGINIVFGFIVPGIDYSAHLGGLVTGFMAASLVSLPGKQQPIKQFIVLILYIIFLVGLVGFGIQQNTNDPFYQSARIDELLQHDKFEEVIEDANKALQDPGDAEAALLFQRSFAYIQLEQIDQAIEDLEKSIQLEELPESYYNLALLYYDKSQTSKAKEAIEKAYKLNPNDENYSQLYEKITGKKAN